MARAFVFPGQGSQKIGMGADLFEARPAARAVFEEADDVLGFALSKLCFEGPDEDLQLTANTQPAILATSIALYRCLDEIGLRPEVVAGHSLGEYSALVAAQSLTLADALRLVRRRGELMQEAVPVGVGAMAAVLGLESVQVEEVARAAAEQGICEIANYNSPEQTVIAGEKTAVEAAVGLAEQAGAKRAILLPVSAPFHCSLMAPAREGLLPMLEDTDFADPSVPLICNVDAAAVATGSEARAALVRQIEGSVRWVESVEAMTERHQVDQFYEVGPGAVLTGLIRRINKMRPTVVSTVAHLESLATDRDVQE